MTTARAQTPARRTGPTEDCVLRRRTNGKFYGFMLHVNLDELLRPRRGVREAQLHDLHTGAESLAGGSAGAGLWSRSSGLRSERGEALPRRLVRSRGAGRVCKVVAAVRGVSGALRTGHRTTHHTTRRARAPPMGRKCMIATQPDTSVWCHPTMICGSSALLGAIVLRSGTDDLVVRPRGGCRGGAQSHSSAHHVGPPEDHDAADRAPFPAPAPAPSASFA